jgi:hypothetical protein
MWEHCAQRHHRHDARLRRDDVGSAAMVTRDNVKDYKGWTSN